MTNAFLKKAQDYFKKLTICQITLVVSLVVIVLYYGFTMIQKKSNSNESFENNNVDHVIVTFYSFDYCGYCKRFQPIWDEAVNKTYDNKPEFRKIEANKLSQDEKNKINNYVDIKYAPCVILSVGNKNISDFEQQSSEPLKGLDKYIESNGTVNKNNNSKHV